MRGTERVHVDYTLENMEQRNADLLSRADVTDGAALSFQQAQVLQVCCPITIERVLLLLRNYWSPGRGKTRR